MEVERRRVVASDIAELRERTGLIKAHAVQLLQLAEGSLDNALVLYRLDPSMFNVAQFNIIDDLRIGTAVQHAAPAGACVDPAADGTAVSSSSRAEDRPCHSRSPAAKKRRNHLNKQRKAVKLAHAQTADACAQGAVTGGHHMRIDRAEAIGFARGVAAEKAAAKQRRGHKRIEKKHKQKQKQAGKRMARRRRAGQA